MATQHYIHNPLRMRGVFFFPKNLNTRKEIQYIKDVPETTSFRIHNIF